jgi:hypothetical protein
MRATDEIRVVLQRRDCGRCWPRDEYTPARLSFPDRGPVQFFGSGGVEKSIPTTAPIAAADAADTRPCQPGTAGSSFGYHVLEGARLHRSKTALRCRV